ncbi:MAG: FAD-dependent oxidoreductase [Lachnospiraceae bacterium]|nr:FAD-dependent oxidoreductase [Lachnospiraceae bacterium]
MIRISQLKLEINHSIEDLERELKKKAYGQKPSSYEIIRRSIDARKKPLIYYNYTIDATFPMEDKILKKRGNRWGESAPVIFDFPNLSGQKVEGGQRPVVVGTGPAGLFAGLLLARAGCRPILFERGDSVDRRQEKVDRFFKTGQLDTNSNVQFGEGGAGTFSDGKLNTMVKDKYGRNRYVLKEFVSHGAPEEILYDAKPHIGTDILKNVVVSIRQEIIELGGEVHFNSRVSQLMMKEDVLGKRKIIGLKVVSTQGDSEAMQEYACNNVILAIGHSSRDTLRSLYDEGVPMQARPFAVGVRVEHPAEMINESQYGHEAAKLLGPATYKLTHQCANGRGIYSFCMCPGGYVVNSSSEEGRLCVNGMSYHNRDSANSNSALITTVTPEDYPSDHPLAGLQFQEKYEALAYQAGGSNYHIPIQLYGDFQENRVSTGFGAFHNVTEGKSTFANLREILPEYVTESLLEGMQAFGRKIKGFDREDAIFSGIEARTSSPVRILREKSLESSIEGLYPCGEGAGYAGGITSAAMDGLKCGQAVLEKMIDKER